MKIKIVIYAFVTGWLLVGCAAYEKKNQSGAAVELNGQYIYRSTLDSLTLGLSPGDSMRVVQQYITQWAKDVLIYDQAQKQKQQGIEMMVANYRRSLYVQAYEQSLIDQRMPKTIMDSTIAQIYQQMPDRFRLDESILKGLLLVVPNDAPNIDKLKKRLSEVHQESSDAEQSETMDYIEKYAYQNAQGYELFTDKWLTTSEITRRIPIEHAELETRLKAKNRIELADSLCTYILEVTEKCLKGEQMPLDYARPEIEQVVLSARQVEFLQKERERLYNEAIQEKKIIFF